MYAGGPFSTESHAIEMKTFSNVSNKVRHNIFSALLRKRRVVNRVKRHCFRKNGRFKVFSFPRNLENAMHRITNFLPNLKHVLWNLKQRDKAHKQKCTAKHNKTKIHFYFSIHLFNLVTFGCLWGRKQISRQICCCRNSHGTQIGTKKRFPRRVRKTRPHKNLCGREKKELGVKLCLIRNSSNVVIFFVENLTKKE